MNTPICDFVEKYINSDPLRLHMPGHKGQNILGRESFDITEIDGADDLFAPCGIIKESEEIASKIFEAQTIYSAGGSTLCIQTIVHLLTAYAVSKGVKPLIVAGQNIHKSFINACALLGTEAEFIQSHSDTYYSTQITPNDVEEAISRMHPSAVYITSPDYLGNISDIKGIAEVCKKNDVLLAVDNAHGAYLKFLPTSLHPIDLGADICCDSAHKTLPVITGGAYLHISENAPKTFSELAKSSMSIFGSSSPSYLILQSLDNFNAQSARIKKQIIDLLPKIDLLKKDLQNYGFKLCGNEPMKLTVMPKSFGITGIETASLLMSNKIYPEFYDEDCVTFMFSSQTAVEDIDKLKKALFTLPHGTAITSSPPPLGLPKRALSPREAMLSEAIVLPVSECLNKICASSAISCPPAVPIVSYGQVINSFVIDTMLYYGIEKCRVCK